MTYLEHVLFCTFLALECLLTDQTMSTLDFFLYKFDQFINIRALISKGWEVMDILQVFFWIGRWTEQAFMFLRLFGTNDWKLRARWSLTSFIAMWSIAGLLNQFFTIILMFLRVQMLFVCLRWKELFRAEFTVQLLLGAAFGA